MGYSRFIDVEHHRILVTAAGDAGVDAAIAEIHAVAAALEDHQHFGVLVDARDGTRAASLGQAHSIVDAFRQHRSAFNGGVAFVVEGQLRYGVGRMLAILAEVGKGPPVNVFLSQDAAEQWLIELDRASQPASAEPPL